MLIGCGIDYMSSMNSSLCGLSQTLFYLDLLCLAVVCISPSCKRWLLYFWDICLSFPSSWKFSSMAQETRTEMLSWVRSEICSSCIFESWKRDTKMQTLVENNAFTELIPGFYSNGACFVFHSDGLVCIFTLVLGFEGFSVFQQNLVLNWKWKMAVAFW